MLRSHKIRLVPNQAPEVYLAKGCGMPVQTAGGGPVAACGEEGSGRRRKTAVKPASAKQEVNHKLAFAPGYE
jgi:hypothetical protein